MSSNVSKHNVIANSATALLVIGIIIGAAGSYLVTALSLNKTINEREEQLKELTTQMGNLSSEIATLENVVAMYQTNVSKLMEERSELEAQIADLEMLNEMLEYRVMELEVTVEEYKYFIRQIETIRYTIVNKTTFYVENFDTTEVGALPEGWRQIQGTYEDVAAVQNDESHSFPNSLRVHEEGEDGDNCKVSLTGLDINETFALEMMFQVGGDPADRGIFQFLNENGEECISINSLIDFKWGNVENGSWREFIRLPAPKSDIWYDVTITGWKEEQKVRLTVNDMNSEWLSVHQEWSTITAVNFRGNYNYAGDSWYDDIRISTIDLKDDIRP